MNQQQIANLVQAQRDFFNSNATKPLAFRKAQLQRLKAMLIENDQAILTALFNDLNKPESEARLTEIDMLVHEIDFMLENLDELAKPKSAGQSEITEMVMGAKVDAQIIYEPYGVFLNISPWNYPIQLSISPIIGAMAAGNTIILKPSEFTVHSSALLAKLVAEYFEPNYFTVVEGDVAVNQQLLTEKFDYIFFTGSVPVGKIVMAAAAKHLTPVTLELGGKSPCIVDETADLKLAAERILFGKVFNSGQTCIAPDYLLVQENVKDRLVEEIRQRINAIYQGKNPTEIADHVKVVTPRHYQRLKAFLNDGRVLVGGEYNDETSKLAFTLIDEVNWQSPVMQEEIFGSIFPMLTFKTMNEAIAQVKANAKPLALYLFTQDKATEEQVLNEVSFGGGCINDTFMHVTHAGLPFGGVGDSGMGGYHGAHSFYEMSHGKSVIKRI
ncbi:aldehyde dehydrogenase family protein [Actinobacillus suis]|uniref:Aldehyde dehydrogenase n=2 Tax=Actinobacillus suis TaxID=716 RepID=K0FYR7_ACTSU|nr:aldehyde dehydrogenase family protein [Actinobacillus suis]AFU19677.1 PutA protein [Actinobacillus suis H91-0380]AIJ31815.1 PutA protein [Actinobacillus suis ATCC 33415]MCO4169554.1 aldehyde dehydrogenase family protein [Actinobacillus suis]MCQ9629281.1 aldehyde dehydrogenase family protein [Actinobacillus suis]MCQ9632331.1 aldehyde dehydrogenase family protein [Actinobacillus suis]